VTPRKSVAAITKLALLLRQTGCFLALDNFSLRTEAFNSLHLPGVALIKLSHEVTVKMQRDQLARAGISAMTQMARVLGIQVVAKRTKLAADLVRLSSFRVDFVQSESISPALPIAALANRRSPSAIVAGSHTPVPTAKAT
jgi:EAL domain-containing protein (putative c-di-GMP-specific phosphodiesterase class I)